MKLHGAAALYVGQSGQPPKCGVLQRQPWSWSKRSLKDEEEGTGGVKRPRPREGRCSGNIELCAAARVLERWPSCRERGALWGSLRTFILHLLRIVLIVLILTHLLVLFRNSDCTAFYDFAYYRNERSGAEEGIPRTSLTVAVIEYAISDEGGAE